MEHIARSDIVSDTADSPAERLAKGISSELRRVARRARVPKPVTSGGGGFRARKSEKLFKAIFIGSFGAIFVVPLVLIGVYLSLIAQDQFISESRFLIRSGQKSGLDALASITSLVDSGQGKDAQIVAQYVVSRAMIDALSQNFDIRRIFRPDNGDFVAQLKSDASIEDIVEYWQDQITIGIDRASGLVTMKVRTFSAEDSLKLSQSILGVTEKMVNKLTRRNEEDALAIAQQEVERTFSKLELATSRLRDARNAAGVLDVDVSAKAYGQIVSSLKLELSEKEREVTSLTQSVVENSPQVIALKNQVLALRQQIDEYQQTIVGKANTGVNSGTNASESLVDSAQALTQQELELKIAQSEYAGASASLEKARLTTNSQQAYLVPYIEPQLAERSLYPKRWMVFGVSAAILFLAWASFAGLSVLVRDHMA